MIRGTVIVLLISCTLVLTQDPLLSVTNQVLPWTAAKISKQMGCKSALPGDYSTAECLANFISDQLQIRGTPNYALAGSFRVGWDYTPPVIDKTLGEYPNTTGADLAERADIYDNAMSVIFLLNQGLIDSAQKISDTLVAIVDNEFLSDGRIRASYSVSSPISRNNYANKYASFAPVATDETIDTGDQAFVIIALCHMFTHTGEYKYLKAAIKIGTFISNQVSGSTWSGYSGGYASVYGYDQKVDWRAIIHNLAIFSAADNLYGLTNDIQWLTMQNNADTLIGNMFDTSVGAYRYGSTAVLTDEWITKTISANAQSFKILTGADANTDRENQAMQWLLNNLITTDTAVDDITNHQYGYEGVVHAQGGSGVDSESTAAAAMALFWQASRIQGSNPSLAQTFTEKAEQLVATLIQMQKFAPQSDGQGIVATPNQEGALVWAGNEFNGETTRFFPLLHTSATAWAGCAVQMIRLGDEYANPFSSYYKKSNKKFYGSSVFASASGIQASQLDTSRPLNIVALIAAGTIGGVLIIGTVILLLTNLRLHKKNKELEVDAPTAIQFTKIETSTPASPGLSLEMDKHGYEVNPHAVYGSPMTPGTPGQERSFLHHEA
jgi:hypothetical protein